MKKICKGCGKNRRLGKFGKQLRSSDGKNPYCKDCMRLYNKRYKRSSKGSSIQKNCVLRYKEKNKDIIKEYNRQYYIKNKARILYNKKCRETTECVNIFDENPKKPNVKKINKLRKVDTIVINPKRK
jgi:predicted Fe-S protein YdhL (DUF1289 family)